MNRRVFFTRLAAIPLLPVLWRRSATSTASFAASLGWIYSAEPWATHFNYGDPKLIDTIRWFADTSLKKAFIVPAKDARQAQATGLFAAAKGAFAETGSWLVHWYTENRRIAHFTYAPLRYIGASERLKAFQRALDREKVDFSDSWVGFGEFSIESGYRAMRTLLERRRRPTALFAGNDTIALGAISALHDAGLSVPGDVAIVGFDDLPIAAYVSPKLTTVATQAIAQGEQAALAAIDLLKGQSVGKRNCNLSLELVVRQSCGAAKANRSLEERRLISQSNPKNLR